MDGSWRWWGPSFFCFLLFRFLFFLFLIFRVGVDFICSITTIIIFTTSLLLLFFSFMLLDNRHSALTKKIIGCAMRVHQELGSGFPELIYQRGLAVELRQEGVAFQGEVHLPVFYKNTSIGSRRADFLVENDVLVELKAIQELTDAHYAQAINYLKAYRLEVALLINFGEASLKFRRFLHNPTHFD